jgi:hypothetical protein
MAPAVTVEYERDCSISENGTAKTKGALAGARLTLIMPNSTGGWADLHENFIASIIRHLQPILQVTGA